MAEDSGEKLTLSIKPTAQQNAKYTVSIESVQTILELKEAVHQAMGASGYPAAEQRLIYKGQILKDERTVSSYGIGNEHVLHLVRGRPAGGDTSSSSAQAAANTTSTPAAPAGGLGGLGGSGGLGTDPFSGLPMPSPEAMQAMMSSPMMQGLLNNPEVMRTMMQSNPMVQQLMERHPELAGVLNDPAMLRQSLQIATNPALMREHMRHADRALSNIEAMPEGFNALRRMFESVQEPLMNATTGPDALANHPLAALLGGAGANPGAAGGPAANTAGSGAVGAGAQQAAASPNASPLPNPWAAGGQAGAGGAGAHGGPAGLGGMGLGGGGFPAGLGGMGGLGAGGANPQDVVAMMQNPAMRQMMVGLMSQPGFVDQIAAMNPMLRQMLEANPALRTTLTDPAVIESLTRPEALQAASALQAAMGGAGGAGAAAGGANPLLQSLLGGAGAGGGGAGLGGLAALLGQGGMGGAAGAGGAGGMDVGALLGALGGLGIGQPGNAGGLFGAAPQVADPETAFASQLAALADMGFTDRAANVRALQATGGNVHAAVDRLLSGM